MDSEGIGLGVNGIRRAVEQSLSEGAKVLEVSISGWQPAWNVSWFFHRTRISTENTWYYSQFMTTWTLTACWRSGDHLRSMLLQTQ